MDKTLNVPIWEQTELMAALLKQSFLNVLKENDLIVCKKTEAVKNITDLIKYEFDKQLFKQTLIEYNKIINTPQDNKTMLTTLKEKHYVALVEMWESFLYQQEFKKLYLSEIYFTINDEKNSLIIQFKPEFLINYEEDEPRKIGSYDLEYNDYYEERNWWQYDINKWEIHIIDAITL